LAGYKKNLLGTWVRPTKKIFVRAALKAEWVSICVMLQPRG
jgi:hypothetical protein